MSTAARIAYAGGIIAATAICSAVSVALIRRSIDRALADFAELAETNAAGAEEGGRVIQEA